MVLFSSCLSSSRFIFFLLLYLPRFILFPFLFYFPLQFYFPVLLFLIPTLDFSFGLYFHLLYLCFISPCLYPYPFFHCLINFISYFSAYIFPSIFSPPYISILFYLITDFPWVVLPAPIFPLNFTCEVVFHATSIGVFIRLSAPPCLGPFSLCSCQGTRPLFCVLVVSCLKPFLGFYNPFYIDFLSLVDKLFISCYFLSLWAYHTDGFICSPTSFFLPQ